MSSLIHRSSRRTRRLAIAALAVAAGTLLVVGCGSDEDRRPVAAGAEPASADGDGGDSTGGADHPLCELWAEQEAQDGLAGSGDGTQIATARTAMAESASMWRSAADVAPAHLDDELALVSEATEDLVEELDRVGHIDAVDLDAFDARFPGAADAEHAIEAWIDAECLGVPVADGAVEGVVEPVE
jgi:hypothetical protein